MSLRIEIEDGRLGSIVVYCEEGDHRGQNLSEKVKEEIKLAMLGERPANIENILANFGIKVSLVRIISHGGEIQDIPASKK